MIRHNVGILHESPLGITIDLRTMNQYKLRVYTLCVCVCARLYQYYNVYYVCERWIPPHTCLPAPSIDDPKVKGHVLASCYYKCTTTTTTTGTSYPLAVCTPHGVYSCLSLLGIRSNVM